METFRHRPRLLVSAVTLCLPHQMLELYQGRFLHFLALLPVQYLVPRRPCQLLLDFQELPV